MANQISVRPKRCKPRVLRRRNVETDFSRLLTRAARHWLDRRLDPLIQEWMMQFDPVLCLRDSQFEDCDPEYGLCEYAMKVYQDNRYLYSEWNTVIDEVTADVHVKFGAHIPFMSVRDYLGMKIVALAR